MSLFRFLTVLALSLALLLTACGTSSTGAPATGSSSTSSGTSGSPDSKGESLVNSRCTTCHTADRVKSAKKSKAEWTATVNNMVSKGAQLNTEEKEAVINYLSEKYK